jgi:hypothetical protein
LIHKQSFREDREGQTGKKEGIGTEAH